MIDLNDDRWVTLTGYDGRPYDPRAIRIEDQDGSLHVQSFAKLAVHLYLDGHIGTASYGAFVLLSRMFEVRGTLLPSLIELLARIELSRTSKPNPDVPEWLKQAYEGAVEVLGRFCADSCGYTSTSADLRTMLAMILCWKRHRIYATALLEYTEDELGEFFLGAESDQAD